jgi:DNA-binding transcriptional MocR family regulator
MLAAMARSFPPGVTWTRPAGGLFLWAALPGTVDANDLLRAALEDKVAFVPGDSFFTDGSGRNMMRLNFTNSSVEHIEEGIARLGRAIRRMMSDSA